MSGKCDQPTAVITTKRGSSRPRPSSSCIERFRCRKLRYAEGLKRHLIDCSEEPDQGSADRSYHATSPKRRHVSPTNTCNRRFSTSIPPSTDVNSVVSASSCQGFSASSGDVELARKGRQPKTCSRCFKTFSTAIQLHKHASSHHVPYKCPLCSQTLSAMSLLKAHINLIHV